MVQQGEVRHISEEDFTEVVNASSERPVVLYFSAEWCVPCRTFGPVMEKIAEEYKNKLDVVKIDADESPTLTKIFYVQGIPSLRILHNGQSTGHVTGSISYADLKRHIDSLLEIWDNERPDL